MLINLTNGKIYIGKTNNPSKRKRDHFSLKKERKGYSLIHRAINKYGSNNFEYRIIQSFNDEELTNQAEQYWINFYQTYIYKFGDSFGYNLTPGGDGLQSGAISGARNPKSKLTENQVLEIKNSNLPSIILGKQYDVNRTTIQKIRSGKTWENFEKDIITTKNSYPLRHGEYSPRSKLNWETVSQIREDFSKGFKVSFLSKKYKTCWSNIKMIVSNQTWIKS